MKANIRRDAQRIEDRIRVCHEVDVPVAPQAVYARIVDVAQWPQIFPPTIYAEQIRLLGNDEQVRIVAIAGDIAKSWESARHLNSIDRVITFRQTSFRPPISYMEGQWAVIGQEAARCTVRLTHTYAAVTPSSEEWLTQVVDRNSEQELLALVGSLEASNAGQTISFFDFVTIHACAERVFDFIDQADLWPTRLPHVLDAHFRRLGDGVQHLEMQTMSADGDTHLTRSYRVVLADQSIVYKQFTLPPIMASHTGRWEFHEQAGSTIAKSHHTIVVDPSRIGQVLGDGTDLTDAGSYVRAAISANSMATLQIAKRFAEARE